MRDVLEKRIRELALEKRVILAGRRSRERIWDFYASADAFVLLSRSESLGMVLWEAMYMNIPIIGRPTGGIVETIGRDGERGFFWDTADGPAAFKEKVLRAVRRDADVRAMIARAKEWVDRAIQPVVID
jgi:glycosyltransferase involved in cell wall biosynthesis